MTRNYSLNFIKDLNDKYNTHAITHKYMVI